MPDQWDPEDGAQAKGPGAFSPVRLVLLFACGFAAAALGIRPLLGDPMQLYAVGRSEKLALMAESPQPYSAVFLGTSHVSLGFDPRVFDTNTAMGDAKGRSFNMGVEGGAHVEQRAMALEVLRHPPQGRQHVPCVVMLEETSGPTFAESFTTHPRQINILDVRSVEMALQFHPYGWTYRYWLHRASISLLALFYHEINMGMLSNRIFRPPLNREMMADERKDDRRGLDFQPSTVVEQQNVARFFAARPAAAQAVPKELGSGLRMEIEDLHAAQLAAGLPVQFVWVSMPTLDDMQRYYVLEASQPTSFGNVPVMDMARPDLYPELYQPQLWQDEQHLNEQGAALFSRLLGQAMQRRFAGNTQLGSRLHGCGG